MRLVKQSTLALLGLVALLVLAQSVQATPLSGPVGEVRTQVRLLQEQFQELVDLLNQLALELEDNQDQDGNGDPGLRDLIIEALGTIETEGDAWMVISSIETVVTVHHRVMTTTFHEIHTLIGELMESVGELEGRNEGLIESGKIRLTRGQKIQRKLDTIASDVTIMQDTFMALEARMEDGDEGEQECPGVGAANCFDDVTDFLFLAIDTISGSMSVDTELIDGILYYALEQVDLIIKGKDRLFTNLREIARALRAIDLELRKAQSDAKKKNKNFISNSERSPGLARVQLFDLQGQRLLDQTLAREADALSLVTRSQANGVYLYVLTQLDGAGQEISRRIGKWIVRR